MSEPNSLAYNKIIEILNELSLIEKHRLNEFLAANMLENIKAKRTKTDNMAVSVRIGEKAKSMENAMNPPPQSLKVDVPRVEYFEGRRRNFTKPSREGSGVKGIFWQMNLHKWHSTLPKKHPLYQTLELNKPGDRISFGFFAYLEDAIEARRIYIANSGKVNINLMREMIFGRNPGHRFSHDEVSEYCAIRDVDLGLEVNKIRGSNYAVKLPELDEELTSVDPDQF